MNIALSTSVIQCGESSVTRHVLALTQALLRHAGTVNFHLLVLQNDLPLFDFAQERMRLVPVAEIWRPAAKNILWHQTVLPRWLLRHQIDVLHVPDPRRMLRRAPSRLIATVHDLPWRGRHSLAHRFYANIFARRFARRQDRLIATSHRTAEAVERHWGIPVSAQRIIHDGVDHTLFRPGSPAAASGHVRQRWGLVPPFFLNVSRLEHPEGNHLRLIEAFNWFKKTTGSPWQLVFAGEAGWEASHIHHAARVSAYGQDIRFLGSVEDALLPDLYRAAACLVQPAICGGSRMPTFEAMACGCPVISCQHRDLDEGVGNTGQIFQPDDSLDLMEALQRIACSPQLREKLALGGLEHANRFHWSATATEVMQTYLESAAPSEPGVP